MVAPHKHTTPTRARCVRRSPTHSSSRCRGASPPTLIDSPILSSCDSDAAASPSPTAPFRLPPTSRSRSRSRFFLSPFSPPACGWCDQSTSRDGQLTPIPRPFSLFSSLRLPTATLAPNLIDLAHPRTRPGHTALLSALSVQSPPLLRVPTSHRHHPAGQVDMTPLAEPFLLLLRWATRGLAVGVSGKDRKKKCGRDCTNLALCRPHLAQTRSVTHSLTHVPSLLADSPPSRKP